MSKTTFLASFVPKRKLSFAVHKIFDNFDVIGDRIFTLVSNDEPGIYIITYNIVSEEDMKYDEIVYNTIPLHRKKKTNTLYTLNALNEVVKMENGGRLDPSFQIDWDKYANCILVFKDTLKIVPTELYRIFHKRPR